MNLILYSREDCDLCRKAEALLDTAGLAGRFRTLDIDDDLELVKKYGDRIPVICNEDTGEKLSWPFTASQVQTLLEAG